MANSWNSEAYRLSTGELASCTQLGGYPLIYITECNNVLCAACTTKLIDEVANVDVYQEGDPLYCEVCNAEIESAYGNPDEDEEEQYESSRDKGAFGPLK